jgi:putative membrane protein
MIAFAAGATSPLPAQNEINKDSKFIREAASNNLLEIRLGTIAQKKASNLSVKQFGERMATDHTRMLDEWRALVPKTGYPFQPGLSNEQEKELKRLEKLSGPEFDREYMTAMIQGHQSTAAKFQGEGQSANSPEVRQLVAAQLPVVQQHLSLATQVGSQVGVPGNVAVTTPTPNAPAPAPTQNPPVAAQNTPVAQEDLRADAEFLRDAIADNVLEKRLGELAQSKSTDAAVKQYAQHLVSDHTIMENQWIALAARNGMTLKSGMGPRHKKKADRLEKLSGRDFDRAFMTTSIQNHQDYVEYFSKDGRATRSAQVRDLAANDLRSFELHLDQAKRIGEQVGVNVAAALRARKSSAYRNQ